MKTDLMTILTENFNATQEQVRSLEGADRSVLVSAIHKKQASHSKDASLLYFITQDPQELSSLEKYFFKKYQLNLC